MITDNTEYYDETFTDLCCDNTIVESAIFENCKFIGCSFKDAKLKKCKLVDCQFKGCNLSLCDPSGTLLNQTEFHDCKMTGINWTSAYWPIVSLCSPVGFYSCDVSLSSFYELSLTELTMHNCKAHDTDFRCCDLSQASILNTDLEKSQFNKTNMFSSDFTGSTNYYINPTENNVKGACFSLPDVLNLLVPFGVKIEDYEYVSE